MNSIIRLLRRKLCGVIQSEGYDEARFALAMELTDEVSKRARQASQSLDLISSSRDPMAELVRNMKSVRNHPELRH